MNLVRKKLLRIEGQVTERYFVDDFLVQYCQDLRVKDYTVKTERLSRSKNAKREYPNDPKTSDLMKKLNSYFESKIQIPRTKVGDRQTLDTLINEEALLFAKYLRDERETWTPRVLSALTSKPNV